MKHLFVPYELSLKLQEKEFDEPYFAYYRGSVEEWDESLNIYVKQKALHITTDVSGWNTETVPAPLYQQVTDWFREEHNIYIHITRVYCYISNKPRTFDGWCVYIDNGIEDSYLECNSMFITTLYDSYNMALDKAIEEALKLIT